MSSETAEALLGAAIDKLGYAETEGESLFSASAVPPRHSDLSTWIDKGEWITLAKTVGADKIFFVNNNPVVVFSKSGKGTEQDLRQLHNRAWCMSRPRLLFLAMPGEIRVYDLAMPPPFPDESFDELKPFEVARSIAEVADKLARFRREEIESGYVFDKEKHFDKDLKQRADAALIHDLKAVRTRLKEKGLVGENLRFAHALIGRSIFIRYLEDRKVLNESYFREVAESGPAQWKKLLAEKQPRDPSSEEELPEPMYPKVLRNHAFTYALFKKLAKDFNGDMFPDVDLESRVVEQAHLNELRDLTYGTVGPQKKLFFFAYRFDIIPIELISSIYEEFYHEQSDQRHAYGAYYTPPALAEFLLSKVLTRQQLESAPRVLDCACGSGIFLVEALRRIVRYRIAQQGRQLQFKELQKILREQVAGIDVNAEAIRIAAFSVYLAMLHYLNPSDIREQIRRGNKLPCLVFDPNRPDSFDSLIEANAFDTKRLTGDERLQGKFGSECADIVVGNPPWGTTGTKKKDADARQLNEVALNWCESRGLPVGDKERSQTFIWRAMDFLKPGGLAGLLLSTGIFLKHHPKTIAFRRLWFGRSKLESVTSFAHARHVFFSGSAVAPFAATTFRKTEDNDSLDFVEYWSAKRTRIVDGTQSVILTASDRRVIHANEDLTDYKLWKTLWWGGHRDRRLIEYLGTLPPLSSFLNTELSGQGYQEADRAKPAEWLSNYKVLPAKAFDRYGPLHRAVLDAPPDMVKNQGVEGAYSGLRFLVGRGIGKTGVIVARLEESKFAFTHAINGLRLPESNREIAQVILGILWSSLARYFLFLTSAEWGGWHDAIQLKDELLKLPIAFPQDRRLSRRIRTIVNTLQTHVPQEQSMRDVLHASRVMSKEKRQRLEYELNEAVFDLYDLRDEDRDLIRDMCNTGLDFLYRRDKSDAVKPVLANNEGEMRGTGAAVPKGPFGDYCRTFMDGWTPYLDKGTAFHWSAYTDRKKDPAMLAVVFNLGDGETDTQKHGDPDKAWNEVLVRLDRTLEQKVSSRIYIDGLARAVTKDSIIIIKRNERRLWTKSMAREDVEATLVQAMNR